MDTASGTATLDLGAPLGRTETSEVPGPISAAAVTVEAHPPTAPAAPFAPAGDDRRAGGVGPTVEFVEVSTRWRQHVTFAAAVEPHGHREQVLDALSLTVPAGQITVLLGARGAGKTLLACHLLGLSAPDSGAVLEIGRASCRERV